MYLCSLHETPFVTAFGSNVSQTKAIKLVQNVLFIFSTETAITVTKRIDRDEMYS